MNNNNIKTSLVKKKVGDLRKIGFNRQSIHREKTTPPFKSFKNTVIWKVMGDRPSGLKCNLFKVLDRISLTMKGVTLNFFQASCPFPIYFIQS